MTKRTSGAVAKTWTVFAKYPKERAAALAACDKAGINSNTAKTQWQRWTHATPAERKAKVSRSKKKEGKKAAASIAPQS